MEILTVVVPDLIRYSKNYFMENSLFQEIQHVRKGTLPAAVGPHPVRTMVDGIDYCASAVQVPNTKQKKCEIVFQETEKVSMDSDYLQGILGKDTVITLGKTKDGNQYFFMIDRNPEQVLLTEELTKIMESLIRLTTNLRLRELTEIEQLRLPVELAGSFLISIKCEPNGKRCIEIFDENLTQNGLVQGFVWRDIVV